MGRKSRKGNSATPLLASARGASISRASAFLLPPRDGGGSSSRSTHISAVFSASPPSPIPVPPAGVSASAAVSAYPPSLIPVPSVGDSTSASSSIPVAAGPPVATAPPQAAIEDSRESEIVQVILNLREIHLRENALAELSKRIESFPDLAPFLWHSFGTMVVLMQELLSIYSMFSSPVSLTLKISDRACNTIALFQCIATHSMTRLLFLKAHIPVYLYQFLTPVGDPKPFEPIRLSTIRVISALMKDPDSDVIISLLASEIMPLCLDTMDSGTEVSRTVAALFVQKLLHDDVGFKFVCQLQERIFDVLKALRNVIASIADKPSIRLLKLAIRCYIRLLDYPRSFWVLRNFIPTSLFDGTFHHCLKEDEAVRILLLQLLDKVQRPHITLGIVINISVWMFSIILQLRFLKLGILELQKRAAFNFKRERESVWFSCGMWQNHYCQKLIAEIAYPVNL